MTDEQRKKMAECDAEERLLALRLTQLLERRREYINQNDLNKVKL